MAEKTQLIRNSTAELFKVDVRTISVHLGNIYLQSELEEKATVRKFRIVQTEGKVLVIKEVETKARPEDVQ